MCTALTWAHRSPCCFYMVGAAIMDSEHNLIGEGYNGPAAGMEHCCESHCRKLAGEGCEGLHAEDNAISHVQDKRLLVGATIYITLQPCAKCAIRIRMAKITRVLAAGRYLRMATTNDNRPDDFDQAMRILSEAGIEFSWFQPSSSVAIRQVAMHEELINEALAVRQGKSHKSADEP